MKKLLALLLCLLILTSAAVCLTLADTAAARDRVTFTERALYGSSAAADGAVIGQQAQLQEHLLWEITYTPGGDAVTEYRFSPTQLTFSQVSSAPGIRMYDNIRHGYDSALTVEESVGLARAYRELYEDTAPGTLGTRTVYLQDYYDYYPIHIDINLPGTLWHGLDPEDMNEEGFAHERGVWDAFTDFFRIPIPEDLPGIEISLVRGESGREIATSSGAPKEGDYYSLYAQSAYTSDTCFLAINNRYGEHFVDTSLIPGGYGIYSFTYRNVRNDTNTQGNMTIYHPGYDTGVDAESLRMVYPLDREVQIDSLQVDPTGECLLAVTQDGAGIKTLLVIDIDTMTTRQSIPLGEVGHISLNHRDGFLVLFYDRILTVYAVGRDGTYVHALTAPQPGLIDDTFADINTYAAMAFDGERLILADSLLEKTYRTMQTCGFCLAVYDSSGLLYYGEYDSSLSVNPDTSRYAFNCLPETLTVGWE